MLKVDFNEITYLAAPQIAVIPYGTDDVLEAAFTDAGITDYTFLTRDEALRDTPPNILALRGMSGPMDLFIRSHFDPDELRELTLQLAGDPDAAKARIASAKANYEWHKTTGQITETP